MPHLSELSDHPSKPGERSFRGASIDEALANARAVLGDDVEALAANRIRRGGVGGFFSTDLGVEVIVAVPHDQPSELPETPGQDGPATPAGIDRLLEAADRQERHSRAEMFGSTSDAPSETPTLVSAPFVEHLRRHLLETGQLDEADLIDAQMRAIEPAAKQPLRRIPDTPTAPMPAPMERVTADASEADAPAVDVPAATALVADASAVGPSEPTPIIPEPTREIQPTTDRGPGRRRDPLRRPVDLATGAVGRLVEQLCEVPATRGSRADRLSRVYVSVTTPDGDMIEVGADLNGPGHE